MRLVWNDQRRRRGGVTRKLGADRPFSARHRRVIAGPKDQLAASRVDRSHSGGAGELPGYGVGEPQRDPVVTRRRQRRRTTERNRCARARRGCNASRHRRQQEQKAQRSRLSDCLSPVEPPCPAHGVCRRQHDTKVTVEVPGARKQHANIPSTACWHARCTYVLPTMATVLRALLWTAVVVAPGGVLLLPFLVMDAKRRQDGAAVANDNTGPV